MSQQGLEVIETTTHKTHEWINALAEMSHLSPHDAYKALRAVLHTLRDRLVVEHSAQFASQLPLLIRGIFYEGWEPLTVPHKLNHDQFLEAVKDEMEADHFIDPERITRDALSIIGQFTNEAELRKLKQSMPRDVQELWPEFTEAHH